LGGETCGAEFVWVESGTEFGGERGRSEAVRRRGEVVFWTA